MVSSRRKEPPPSAHAFNRPRDIAKNWLRRFNGVASSYLKHYLGCFRTLDLSRAPALTPSAMLALAVGV
jgi:hypothetical protein